MYRLKEFPNLGVLDKCDALKIARVLTSCSIVKEGRSYLCIPSCYFPFPRGAVEEPEVLASESSAIIRCVPNKNVYSGKPSGILIACHDYLVTSRNPITKEFSSDEKLMDTLEACPECDADFISRCLFLTDGGKLRAVYCTNPMYTADYETFLRHFPNCMIMPFTFIMCSTAKFSLVSLDLATNGGIVHVCIDGSYPIEGTGSEIISKVYLEVSRITGQ